MIVLARTRPAPTAPTAARAGGGTPRETSAPAPRASAPPHDSAAPAHTRQGSDINTSVQAHNDILVCLH